MESIKKEKKEKKDKENNECPGCRIDPATQKDNLCKCWNNK